MEAGRDERRVRGDIQVSGRIDIYETRILGLATTRLTDGDLDEQGPAYAPEGRTIAFSAIDPDRGDGEIYRMASDGSAVRRLTTGLDSPRDVEWSPKGDRIAFTESVPKSGTPFGIGTDVFTMNPGGSDVTRLTSESPYNAGPRFSPSGNRIAFTSSRNLPTGLPQSDVFVMNADGSDQNDVASDREFAEVATDWGPIPSAAAAPLPVPPPVLDACPGVELKRVIPATHLRGRVRGDALPDVLLSGRRGRGAIGGGGEDCLFAGAGPDALSGGPGNDVLSGGPGEDEITCGPGRDLAFVGRTDDADRSCERLRTS